MFYSEEMLSRRGPLGRVWLAAHMERKLSKTQALQTDIEQSVGEILGQEVELMALRLSGQLLLGVVRIYSRKARYLLDDCNEALLKIKLAFRPGVVDMTEDQLAVNKNTITLQGNSLDIDLLLPDINWDREFNFEDRPLAAQGHHQAHIDDITLRTAADTVQSFDLNDPFDIGPSDGIGSQDFLDLGLDWGDKPENEDNMSIDGSVGVGRDLPTVDESLDAQFLDNNNNMDIDLFSNHSKSRQGSEHPFDGDMMNIDLPDIGLDINFGDGDKTPGQARSSRASSPLTEPPATPPPEDPVTADKTPKAKRKPKDKMMIVDERIELESKKRLHEPVVSPEDLEDILVDQHFLPRDPLVMRLLEIREDPIAHFLPTKVTPEGTFFLAGPPGLAPELAELFMRPVTSPSKRKTGAADKGANKRPRLDDEVEQPRRDGSVAPSIGGRSELRGGSMAPDNTFDFGEQNGMPLDDFQLEIPELDANVRNKSVPPSELSRLSTPAPDVFDEGVETYADATCPIYMFDMKMQSQPVDEAAEADGKGYSKNTIKALGIIRKELQPVDDNAEEKVLSFRQMADKASRRAAASFFFELLVLSTRDCIKIDQAAPFENIEVTAKDKLWERQGHASASRAPSVARSVGTALGL
uniref:RAD21 protein n=1 Tax=Mycena chlorophos TaxID=658473 RepID=A0ABQ0M2S8_MYCCL|nr:RAD21 protein [Mycena chlorophos]